MNMILCGMPSCGKTYYGKIIANKLNRSFIDIDELITNQYFKLHQINLTCREITIREGDCYFRKLETDAVKELTHIKNSVISLGGGTLCFKNNISYLENLGQIFYLKTSLEILLKRIAQNNVIPTTLDPKRLKESLEDLHAQRHPIYEALCSKCIDTSKENVIKVLHQYANEGT